MQGAGSSNSEYLDHCFLAPPHSRSRYRPRAQPSTTASYTACMTEASAGGRRAAAALARRHGEEPCQGPFAGVVRRRCRPHRHRLVQLAAWRGPAARGERGRGSQGPDWPCAARTGKTLASPSPPAGDPGLSELAVRRGGTNQTNRRATSADSRRIEPGPSDR